MKQTWWAVGLLLLLALPGLQTPLVLDDWIQRALIAKVYDHVGPWDLYTFARGDPEHLARFIADGPYPWFTLPGLKISFFRPLSVGLLHLDVWLFGASAVLARLHSIAWALVMLAAAHQLYRKLLGPAAGLAVILFAVDDSHLMPTIWLANRNSLVAGAFALWGFVAHLAWRGGRVWLLPVSVTLFAAALASSEAALGFLALLFAFELLRDRRKLRALVPVTVVLAAYIVVYRVVGAGAWGSAIYIDPLREPVEFLQHAPVRLLALFGSWNSGLGADFWLTAPALRPALIGAGVLGVIGWSHLARSTSFEPHERKTLKWLAGAAFFGVVPTLATFPADRLLMPASFALCGILAIVLQKAIAGRRKLVIAWAVVAFGLAPLSAWVITPMVFTKWANGVERAALHPKNVDTLEHRRVVVVVSTDFSVAIYAPSAMTHAGKALPLTWNVLSMAPHAHRLTRVDAATIELKVLDGRMLDSVFEQNMRAERFEMTEGFKTQLRDLTVTVMRVDKGRPVAIRATFERPLEDFTFVTWNGHELERIDLPQVGASVELPRAPLLSEQVITG